MNILHIFKNTNRKFYEPYIKFINENFDSKRHYFIIEKYDSKLSNKYYERNLEYINKIQYTKLIKRLYISDKIILHSLMSPRLVLILFLQPWLLKKCYWIVWGGDLYYYTNRTKNFKSNFYELLRKFVIKNIGNICTLVKEDYKLAQKWYNVKAKQFNVIYVSEERINYVNEILKSDIITTNKDNQVTSILLGNSATNSNNHIEALQILSKFNNKNIKIICPLSYGNMEYAEEVIQYGKKIFGNKFIALKEFISKDRYIDLLCTIDIGIFNNNRQQALGNIFLLSQLGKKVFIRDDTTMWNELYYDIGLNIYSINAIPNLTYDNFKNMEKSISEMNKKILNVRYNIENVKNKWSKVFNDNNIK